MYGCRHTTTNAMLHILIGKLNNTLYIQKNIKSIAKQIIAESSSKILCFYGSMGVGKTSLIKAIINELGSSDIGNSPTFGIVNEYRSQDDQLLAFHFDFYRLEDETEALDLGLEDYLNSDAWIFIEWPEKILSYIPNDATRISLNIIDDVTRSISID